MAATCIPAIHRLEQISSDEHVGSVAENLLEALRDDPKIAVQVECCVFALDQVVNYSEFQLLCWQCFQIR